jgi:hypothetical protein
VTGARSLGQERLPYAIKLFDFLENPSRKMVFEKRVKARRQTGPARPQAFSNAARRRCQAL